jgi:hypothetical protein
MKLSSLASFELRHLPISSILISCVLAVLNATKTAHKLVTSNDRPYAAVNKPIGAIDPLRLDEPDLLGPRITLRSIPFKAPGGTMTSMEFSQMP